MFACLRACARVCVNYFVISIVCVVNVCYLIVVSCVLTNLSMRMCIS